MKKTTLLIMAAGIGSRFGTGIKQLEPVGLHDEIIMDYSIHDAISAGFFAAKDLIHEPFAVINADDYYGKEAYREAYSYLVETGKNKATEKLPVCMVGFKLKNTLSENGGVTRGICNVDEDRMLTSIVETHNIVKKKDGAAVVTEGVEKDIDLESEVSMNMWGLIPEFFDVLEEGFSEFLEDAESGDLKAEYLLPTIIGNLLENEKVTVKVLQSKDKWFGVTYKEDKDSVVNSIKELIAQGHYQKKSGK